MPKVSLLYTRHLVAMLFWQNLAVLDGLDGGMMVVLVNFAVDCGGDILVASGSYVLILNSWVYGL